MNKKRIIAFCPADKNNLKHFEMMKNSLRKFHSEQELPLLLIDEEKYKKYNDSAFFYRATPIVARELIKEYDIVLKLDSDQIITGPLNEIWENTDYDVAVVNNSNPKEFQAFPYQFLNIHPLGYVNCGFVAMRSEAFINWWYNICQSFLFGATQMREQDWLNVMVSSGNYSIKRLDEGESFYGLASKGYWQYVILNEKNELILLKDSEQGWPDKSKKIKVVHWAGGNSPDKMNYRIRFSPEVVKRLDYLVK